MAVTIKQIAEACGVSRGTVDRVLNNRGKVKPDIDVLVRKKAEELGYHPNKAAKALAARKKNYVIGIILISEGNEFFQDVLAGIHKGKEELADYGVRIVLKTMKGYEIERQLELMEQLREEIQFLILEPINEKVIVDKIEKFINSGIPVLTINSDIEESKRLCYVGSDYKKSGETAAGILSLLTHEKAYVGIATGSVKVLGHNQRIMGFQRLCKNHYKEIIIVDIIETNDDDTYAYQQTKKMLKEHPELSAVYIVAAGASGVCRAISELGRENNIITVSCDDTVSVREWIKKGIIKATICQEPEVQGYQAVSIAGEYLVKGISPTSDYIVKNEIKIKESFEE